MNAPVRQHESASQREFIKHANFEPVFDQNGNIVDIRELKISTDRRAGVKAMRELFDTHEQGDDILCADGRTYKQRRILATPAPLAAHYLKPSEKYDAKTGMMRAGVLIQLPFEVVWTQFELLFDGQYSVIHKETVFEDEEIMPVGKDHSGRNADDAPGRRFFARATVTIRLHLPGQAAPRDYDGVGVAFGHLATDKTGNGYKINSERRTVEKGAIADAKREALANMGAVFRRAFEDGDEMIEHIERLVLQKIQEQNKPAIQKRDRAPVPAPVRARPAPVSEAPAEKDEAQDQPTKPDQAEGGGEVTAKVDAAIKPKPVKQTSAQHETQNDPAQAVSGTEVSADTEAKEVAAPKADTPAEAAEPDRIEVKLPKAPARLVSRAHFIEQLLDILYETCETSSQARALIEANEKTLDRLKLDRTAIEETISFMEENEDGIPDFDEVAEVEGQVAENEKVAQPALPIVSVAGKSGKAVLEELKAAIAELTEADQIDQLIKVNEEALRKLTPKQTTQLHEAAKAKRQALTG